MELVNRHHAAQKLVARNAVAEMSPLWGILDFHDLNGSTADWLRAVRPVVERARAVSQYVAAQFVQDYRRTLFPNAEPLDIDLPNPLGLLGVPHTPRETSLAIMVAMKVTGPLHVVQLMPMDEGPAMEAGFSKSVGAATRLILNGGRGMVRLLADADPLAQGVAGVADPESDCRSCLFLTTPILKRDGARKMNAVAVGHDFCQCSARLVY